MAEAMSIAGDGPMAIARLLKGVSTPVGNPPPREAAPARTVDAEADAAAKSEAQAQVRLANEAMAQLNVDLRFRVEGRSVVIYVLDGESGHVIRSVPPDYFLKAAAGLGGGAGMPGVLVDEGV
jgi:uncharacterized FlaG/YvyC family protein